MKSLLCFFGWHNWSYTHEDNFNVLIRKCKHCSKKMQLIHGNSIASTDYWSSM